jgi:uroporphyrinogen-III decarboxylase
VYPTLRRASELAHAAGKLHWVHACGKLGALLPRFREAGIDGVESLTPPPFADTPLGEARRAWKGAITIDGGISPHLLVGEVSDRELERAVLELFAAMGEGDNFVLSVSDDTPVDARIERLRLIGDLVRAHGHLPLAVPSSI